MYICNFCHKKYEKERSRRSHQVRCGRNPNRVEPKIDYSKKRNNNQFTKAKELGLEKPKQWNEGKTGVNSHSIATRKKLSKIAKKRKLGGVRASQRINYNGKILGSSYELAVVKDLDANGIIWETCQRFSYIDSSGIERTYTPDIYLPDYDVYLDPKNDFLINNINPSLGFTDQEKIKFVEEQNNISIFILNKNQLSWKQIKLLIGH